MVTKTSEFRMCNIPAHKLMSILWVLSYLKCFSAHSAIIWALIISLVAKQQMGSPNDVAKSSYPAEMWQFRMKVIL